MNENKITPKPMSMDISKSRILRTITSVICLCAFWMDSAFGDAKGIYPKRPAKIARISRAGNVPNRSVNAMAYSQLAGTVDLSAINFHTPFSQAIEILQNSMHPSLNIVVLWRDLSENASVERDTPVCMEGLSGIQIRTALELLLRAVSSSTSQLGYIIEGGVIIIATRDSLPVKRVTRVYDISDLVAEPANYRFGIPFAPFGLGNAGLGGGWMGQGAGRSPAPVQARLQRAGGFGGAGGANRR